MSVCSPACPRRCVHLPLAASLCGERSKRNGEERDLISEKPYRIAEGKPGGGRLVPIAQLDERVGDRCGL